MGSTIHPSEDLTGSMVTGDREDTNWPPEYDDRYQPHYSNSNSTLNNDPLESLPPETQFDFSRAAFTFAPPNHERNLSTQTAPPFRTSPIHVPDYRPYHTDSFVQNPPHQSFSGFHPNFGVESTELNVVSHHKLVANSRERGDFYQNILPVPVYTPGTVGVETYKESLVTADSSCLQVAKVPTDVVGQLTSMQTVPSGKQGLAFKQKPKRRRGEGVSSTKKKQNRNSPSNCLSQGKLSAVDESFLEDWLLKYPSVFPREKHFRALADLTQLDVETIELWFTQKWQRRSIAPITARNREDVSLRIKAGSSVWTSRARQPSDRLSMPSQRRILLEASTWVRERGTKCVAVKDLNLLMRDPTKPYACTLKCSQTFKDKDDWRKHEEVNYPQEGWACDLEAAVVVDGVLRCSFCGTRDPSMDHATRYHQKSIQCHKKRMNDRGRLHFRKQHFCQHMNNVHPNIPRAPYLESNHFTVESKFPRRCGFCPYNFDNWRDRIEHISVHFVVNGEDMTQWDDDQVEDDDDHENSDDEDDGGSDDGSEDFYTDSSISSDDDSDAGPRPPPKQRDCFRTSPTHNQSHKGTTLRNNCPLPQATNMRREEETEELSTQLSMIQKTSHIIDNISGHNSPEDATTDSLYARIRILGIGPYSVVDEVQDVRNGTILARKTIQVQSSSDSVSLSNEVEIMKKIKHPHIVRFLSAFDSGFSFSILMTPSADYDLGHFMAVCQSSNNRPSVDTVVQWFSCLVSSVKYLHDEFVKHQDIKPSNILLKSGHILLADFGIAKVFSNMDPTSVTRGAVTRKYCAPETAKLGMRGHRADIFSLGCVLLEMCSFLIYDSRPAFNEYQDINFSSDQSYHQNLGPLKDWIHLLRCSLQFTKIQLSGLRDALDVIETMIDENRVNRPTARSLSNRFQPKECCLMPVDPPQEHTVYESGSLLRRVVSNSSISTTSDKLWDIEETIIPERSEQLGRNSRGILSRSGSISSISTTPDSFPAIQDSKTQELFEKIDLDHEFSDSSDVHQTSHKGNFLSPSIINLTMCSKGARLLFLQLISKLKHAQQKQSLTVTSPAVREARNQFFSVMTSKKTISQSDWLEAWYSNFLECKIRTFWNSSLRSCLAGLGEKVLKPGADEIAIVYRFLSRVAVLLQSDQEVALVGIVDALINERILIEEPEGDDRELANQMTFAAIGWLTMLYDPSPRYASKQVLEIRRPAGGPPIATSLNTRTITKFSIDFDYIDQPFAALLRQFGTLMPQIDVDTRSHEPELITVAYICYAMLEKAVGIKIEWVNSLSLHLEFDSQQRVLKIFRFPSFCLLMLQHPSNRTLLSQLYKCDNNYFGRRQVMDDPSEERSFFKEMLLSYRLIFGQDKRSWQAFTNISNKWDPAWSRSDKTSLDHDPLLPILCGQSFRSHGARAIYGKIHAPDVSPVFHREEFPFFGQRLMKLQNAVKSSNPHDWRALWYDRSDPVVWWNFWAVLFIGGTTILLMVGSLALQGWAVLCARSQLQQGLSPRETAYWIDSLYN